MNMTPTLSGDFKIADNAREAESKFLSELHPSHPIGEPVLHYFCNQLGFEGYSNPVRTILTHQFDNDDGDLLKKGITLRTRSTLDARGHPSSLDICIKVNKPSGKNDAFLDRAEYEAPISGHLNNLDLDQLLFKYSPRQNPELPGLIKTIRNANPSLQFVMPVERTRHVVDVPGYYFDVYDPAKKAVIELNDDQPSFGMDIAKGAQPLIFAQDRELEFEILDKPCTYDSDHRKHGFISRGLTAGETQRLFEFVNNSITEHALKGSVEPNMKSKAHRGFAYKEQTLERLDEMYASLQTKSLGADQLTARLAYLLGRNGGDSLPSLIN